MNRVFFACIFTMAGIIVSGCEGGLFTPARATAPITIVQAHTRESSHADLMAGVDPHD